MLSFLKQDNAAQLWKELHKKQPDEFKCCKLVEADPGIANNPAYSNRPTPLMLAVKNNMPWLVDVLVRHGASLTATDILGRTAMHYASAARNTPWYLIDNLVQAGVPVDTPDCAKRTPLHYAIVAGNAATAHHLVRRGANTQAPDDQGMTPARLAEQTSPHLVRALDPSPPRLEEALPVKPKQPPAPPKAKPLTVQELMALKGTLKDALRKATRPGPKPDADAHALAVTKTAQALLDVDARLRQAAGRAP